MRNIRYFLALIFFILFFIWAQLGKGMNLFTIYFPFFHFLFALSLILFLFWSLPYSALKKVWAFLERRRYWIFPPAGFLLALSVGYFFLDGVPHIQDGINYLYMAENFAKGKLSMKMPYNYEFFEYIFMMVDGEKHFSLFMPGYSFFLVPFVWMKATFLANPILIALDIWLLGRFTEHLFNRRTAALTMFLFVLSPFMLTLGGTWMSHPFCALMTLTGIYGIILSLEKRSTFLPLLSGFALGWLMITRPQNVLFLAPALALLLLRKIRKKGTIRVILLAAVPGILFGLFILFYNNHFTKDPFCFIQDMHFNISEPVDYCHHFGIGKGCAHCNGDNMPKDGLTWSYAVYVSFERLFPLVTRTLTHPILFIFVILALLFRSDRREERKGIFLALIFTLTFCGYFFFYFNGNVYGPRYLYEVSYFLMILMALGMIRSWEKMEPEGLGRNIMLSLFTAVLAFQYLFMVGELYSKYKKGFWGVGHHLQEEIEEREIHNAVVFINPPYREILGCGFSGMDLSDFENNDVIYVRDLGEKTNSRYMHFMKGRSFYRAFYAPWTGRPPVIEKINPEYPPGYVITELEDKAFPYSNMETQPDYCNFYPPKQHINKFLPFKPPLFNLSKAGFYCRFREDTQVYTFGQHFNESGYYSGTLRGVKGSHMGKFQLLIDGESVLQMDMRGEGLYKLEDYRFEVELAKGFHTMEIRPLELQNEEYFIIDYIEFEKKEQDHAGR